MLGVLLNEKLYKNTYSTLKYFSFFLSTKWIGFLFCIFLKWRKKTCQFPFSQNSFTKTPNLIEETPHWRAWGCASALPEFISGPWTNLTHLPSQQCAGVSSPPLSYLESCRCSLKGQVPPGCGGCTRPGHSAMPGQSRSCCLCVPAAGRAEEGLSPLHHTDVESNPCCISTEAASFSHGGGRKPKIQTVTVRLAHCYVLGQEHIYNSSCDIVLSVS